jgi:hypothetical protein
VTAIATGCPKLRSVYLGTLESNCDAIHTFASHCPELQSIDGVSLQLTDAGLAALASNCADFSTLNSTVWEVTDESVVHAAHLLLPRLRRIINIEAKKSVHTECYNNTLVQAVAYMHDLRTFILYANSASIGLHAVLAMKSSKLRGVAFSFDNPVHDPATGPALVNLVCHNPLLEYLQWPGNGWLSDDVLATIAACCPLLRELYAECKTPSALTDASVVALAQGCHQLTKVEGLSGPALTDASVMALAQHCPNLETVHLQHSPLVTEAALTTLAQRCLKLDYLKVCVEA